ncbi:MAG TPA: hypothetical protein VF789_05805 [Thermoanaerobaculia bacterium]
MALSEPQVLSEDIAGSQKSRRLRICELILVLSVGYLVSTVSSFEEWWTGEPPMLGTATAELYWILEETQLRMAGVILAGLGA